MENIAPHFSLWFKKDFAWTYLIAKYEKNDKAYAQAKTFIKNQIKKNYDEPDINEMWHIMFSYIALIEGDEETALENFKKQSEINNPVQFNWKIKPPNTLNENIAFKEPFFTELTKLGLQF